MSRGTLLALAVAALTAAVVGGALLGGLIGEAAPSAPVESIAGNPREPSDATPPQVVPGRVMLSESDVRRGVEAGLLPTGVKSVLDVKGTMRHGEFRWDDNGVPPGRLDVRVDVDRQLVSVFRGGHEIGAAVVLFGADGKPTPIGRFPIKDKREDYHSRTYDAPMPYSLWLTDDGVAVHGSNVRDGRATNGCVGVPIEFARLLFEQASVGDVVEVVSSKAQRG